MAIQLHPASDSHAASHTLPRACRADDRGMHRENHPLVHRTAGIDSGGFSLIELMVTIAIVAILISVALPSLSDTIARNRIAASANDFIAGLSYARTEAIRTNHHAGVCPSASGQACDGAWGDRWIVYTGEPNKPTVLKLGEFSEKDQFVSEAPTAITFDARGMLATAPNSFELQPDQCGAGKPMRRLFNVQRTGNVSMTPGACL